MASSPALISRSPVLARSGALAGVVSSVFVVAALASCQFLTGVTPCRHGEDCPSGTACSQAEGVCLAERTLKRAGNEGEGPPASEGEGAAAGEGEGEGGLAGEGEGSAIDAAEGEGEGTGVVASGGEGEGGGVVVGGEGEGEGLPGGGGGGGGPPSCPANSTVSGTSCTCNTGFVVDSTGAGCAAIQCPANSSLSGNQCVCNAPFVPSSAGNACVCPANSSQSGNQCVCNSGFVPGPGGCVVASGGGSCGGCGVSCGGGSCGCGGCGCGGGELERGGNPGVSTVLRRHPIANLVHRTDELVLIEAGGELIETTAAHPFLVDGAGYVVAGDLARGDRMVTMASGPVTIERVSVLRGSFVVKDPAFDDDDGMFLLGDHSFVGTSPAED